MTNHTVATVIVPLLVIGVLLFGFFRTPWGARVINKFRPKPKLTDLNAWEIGPTLPAGNMSKNMPLHPIPYAGSLFSVEMPTPTSEPHYITVDHGPLTGMRGMRIKGRTEGGPFFAKDGVSQASICFYFQRQFDDWDATINETPYHFGDDLNLNTQYYRWFGTPKAIAPLVLGPIDMEILFTDKWTALQATSEDSFGTRQGAAFFKGAIDNAGHIGFVLGGGDGWGHGIVSPNPSRIIVDSFEVF